MHDICAAVFLAQTFVGGGDIKQQRARNLCALGRFQQRVGGKIRDDQPRAFAHEFIQRRAGVLALAEFYVDSRKGLAGEFACGVVVGGAHQRAGKRVVLGGNVLNGEGLARMRLPQHADLDRQRLGERGGGEE